jgi:hypothetical protein
LGAPVCGAQLRENTKVAGQLDIVGDRGEVAQDVIAPSLREIRVGKFVANGQAQLVDRAALLEGNFAEYIQAASSRNT